MDQEPVNILLTCLSYTSDENKVERLKNVSIDEWSRVVELVHQHKVTPNEHTNNTLRMTIPSPKIGE